MGSDRSISSDSGNENLKFTVSVVHLVLATIRLSVRQVMPCRIIIILTE